MKAYKRQVLLGAIANHMQHNTKCNGAEVNEDPQNQKSDLIQQSNMGAEITFCKNAFRSQQLLVSS